MYEKSGNRGAHFTPLQNAAKSSGDVTVACHLAAYLLPHSPASYTHHGSRPCKVRFEMVGKGCVAGGLSSSQRSLQPQDARQIVRLPHDAATAPSSAGGPSASSRASSGRPPDRPGYQRSNPTTGSSMRSCR